MIQKRKKQLIIASLLTLLPIPLVLLFGGQASGEMKQALIGSVCISCPLMLLLMWLALWITAIDNKHRQQNPKVLSMVLWLVPGISIFVSAFSFLLLGGGTDLALPLICLFMGALFVWIGNYMPKCRPNRTIGIRVSWTLGDEENWNATHRLGGRVWFWGGVALALCVFLPVGVAMWLMFIIIMVITLIPLIYSYCFYKKRLGSGAVGKAAVSKTDKCITAAFLIFIAVTLVLLFVGKIEYTFGDTALTIDPSFQSAAKLSYDKITDLEYREENMDGTRTWGYGSYRLLLGQFENEEFGTYTRYTYYRPDACIVITAGEKTYVLSGRDPAETQALYQELASHVN